MPDIWFDVDTAISEAPINILPLIDDTDFKSREESVAYDAAGLDLIWNFVTTAGGFTQTEVTPTDTGGAYDWVNQGNGYYTIEIPASGGASINNDTEGFGWFSGVATGILPWRGPTIGFRAAGLNNILIDSAYSATRGLAGTALPDAAADAAGGLPISDAGGLDMDSIRSYITYTGTATDGGAQTITLDAGASATDSYHCGQIIIITGGTGIGQSRSIVAYIGSSKIATVSNNWITQPNATSTFVIVAAGCPVGVLSRGFATAGAAGTITLQTGETWATSFLIGSTVRIIAGTGKGQIRSITANTNATPSVVSVDRNWTSNPDTTSVYEIFSVADAMLNTNDIGSSAIGATQIASNAIAAAKIATGAITSAKFAAGAINAAAIADGAIDAATFAAGAINAAAIAADAIDADALATDAVNEIADATLDRASAIESNLTLREALRLIASAVAGKLSGAETTTITLRSARADDKNRIVATVDADGNRTAITYDVS